MIKLFAASIITAFTTPALVGEYLTQCETTSMPYQEDAKQLNPGSLLGGALIGGLIGKAATGENGGAAVGAIIGVVADGLWGQQSRSAAQAYLDRFENGSTPKTIT